MYMSLPRGKIRGIKDNKKFSTCKGSTKEIQQTYKTMNKTMKPRGVVKFPPRELSEEEKKGQVLQFLTQRREEFSIRILQGLCAALGDDATNAQAKTLVGLSVEMADELIGKLYPLPKEVKE